MNLKNFIIGGIVGGIADFILGGLFYQVVFPTLYPPTPDMKMSFIAMGCMTFGFLVSYIFNKWAGITTFASGAMAGAIIGLFYGLSMNFFMYSGMPLNIQNFATDAVVNILMGAGVGGAVGFVLGKLK